jgi:hypothetical protein
MSRHWPDSVTRHGGRMVADIQLLQGKIIDDPEQRALHMATLIEALATELQLLDAKPIITQLECDSA